MKYFMKIIIIFSIIIVFLSVFNFLDYYIVNIFHFKNDVISKLTLDVLTLTFELSLLIGALIAGRKIIYKIKDEEEQYKRLVEMSPEAIIIHDKGKILYINESGVSLFGLRSAKKFIDGHISALVHRDSMDSFTNLIKEASQFPNSVLNKQIRVKRMDGTMMDLEYKSTQISFKGQAAREMIVRDITMQKEEMENVKRLAYQDDLTGLPNRRALMEHLKMLLDCSESVKKRFCLMFIDLDGFKQVNDTFGHHVGDSLLKHAADKFKKCVANKGIVARLAGDEFIIILHNIGQEEHIFVAKEIIESFRSPIIVLGKEIQVTPSIGIAIHPQHGCDATELFKNADIAMYEAKQKGKNSFQIYNSLT